MPVVHLRYNRREAELALVGVEKPGGVMVLSHRPKPAKEKHLCEVVEMFSQKFQKTHGGG